MSEKYNREYYRLKFLAFIRLQWESPDDDENYAIPPKAPGVYCLEIIWDIWHHDDVRPQDILYVGSSSNLFNRSTAHEIIKNIKVSYADCYVRFWFKPTNECKKAEKKLIEKLQPLLNRVRNIKIQ